MSEIVIILVNIYNAMFWIVWPSITAFTIHKLFDDPKRKLEFLAEYNVPTRQWIHSMSTGKRIEVDDSCELLHVRVRLWKGTGYYEWKMSDGGEMIVHDNDAYTPRSLFSRNRIYLYTPATDGSRFTKCKIKWSYALWSFTGMVIRYKMRQEFVLAKLGGFETYNWRHDCR